MNAIGLMMTLLLSTSVADNQAYQAGLSLYREMEFEQALFRLQEVAVNPSLPDADKADAFVWMGLCYAGMGNEAAARQAFADGIRRNYDVTLPKVAPPKVKKWFAEEHAKLPKPSVAPPSKAVTSPPPATEDRPTAPPAAVKTPEGTTSETALELQVEQPPEESGMGPLLLAGGATAVVVGFATATGGFFFLRDMSRLDEYIAQTEATLARTDLQESARREQEAALNTYTQARTTDLIVGAGLMTVGLAIAAGGAGVAAFSFIE